MRITAVEHGNRVCIPADWATELGIEDVVELVKVPGGVMVSRHQTANGWDTVLSEKLETRRSHADVDSIELTGDDLLF